MKNLIIDGVKYNNIYINNDIIVKYSSLPCDMWYRIIDKNLYFLNTPKTVTNIMYSSCETDYKSKVTLPYLKDYKSLSNETFTQNLNTLDILNLLKKNLTIIKDMHKNNVIHCDLWSDNIMINKELEFKIIDLDSVIIDDLISIEAYTLNKYKNDDQKNIKEFFIIQDKLNILNLFMYYLYNNKFRKSSNKSIDITSLNFPKYIEKEITYYLEEKQLPSNNYYFIDIIDELINREYKSLSIEKRLIK